MKGYLRIRLHVEAWNMIKNISGATTVADFKKPLQETRVASIANVRKSGATLRQLVSHTGFTIKQVMRHIKTNLKNSKNIGSKDCAQTFSFMYSLTESCAMNGLSPMRYIKMLLEKLKDEKVDKRMLLPCNYREVA